jgi:hypothetical protein
MLMNANRFRLNSATPKGGGFVQRRCRNRDRVRGVGTVRERNAASAVQVGSHQDIDLIGGVGDDLPNPHSPGTVWRSRSKYEGLGGGGHIIEIRVIGERNSRAPPIALLISTAWW